MMWQNKKLQKMPFPSCQTYKPIIIFNQISKWWYNIRWLYDFMFKKSMGLFPDT